MPVTPARYAEILGGIAVGGGDDVRIADALSRAETLCWGECGWRVGDGGTNFSTQTVTAYAERDEAERAQALHQLGIEPGGTVPPALRRQLKELEDAQKQRAKRGMRDGVDRILVDLLSLYRDILMTQLGVGSELVNEAMRPTVLAAAAYLQRAAVIDVLDSIRTARERIEANVPPVLALEAMLVRAARAAQRR